MPTVEELASVMDLTPGDLFENLVADPDAFYWIGAPSPILANAKVAWSFADTGFETDGPVTASVRRWYVRGGQNTVG